MNPQPVRFAAYVRDEAHLTDELHAKLSRAIERERSLSEVARKMKVSRQHLVKVTYRKAGFSLGMAFALVRAYPDA